MSTLTFTHTHTEKDWELIRMDMNRRIREDFIIKPSLEARRKARWPFRLLLLVPALFCLILAPFQGDKSDKIMMFTFGLILLTVFIIPSIGYLFAWSLMFALRLKSRQIYRRQGFGRNVTWEITDEGITIDGKQKFPWTIFASFEWTEAGLLMFKKDRNRLFYIPASAVADPSVKAQLQEILSRYIIPPVIPAPPVMTS